MRIRINQILTGLLSCVAFSASAEVIAFASDTRGQRILLHSERGMCTEKALRARFVDHRGFYVEGCWKVIDQGNIQIAFLDGDFAVVPMKEFKKPGEI